jgi:hypothetical protein
VFEIVETEVRGRPMRVFRDTLERELREDIGAAR